MADISTSFPNLETQTKIAKSLQDIADKYNKITDIVYPVGSIYMSVSSTEPSLLFGGTWERIQDRFLLAAGSTYDAGTTGGNSTHQHWYGFVICGYYGNFVGENGPVGALMDGAHGTPSGFSDKIADATVTINNGTQQSTHSANAARYESRTTTTAESSMPPYLTVYMWKRTA